MLGQTFFFRRAIKSVCREAGMSPATANTISAGMALSVAFLTLDPHGGTAAMADAAVDAAQDSADS